MAPPGSNPHWTMVLSFRWGAVAFGYSIRTERVRVLIRQMFLIVPSSWTLYPPACCASSLSCRCKSNGVAAIGGTWEGDEALDLIGACTYLAMRLIGVFPSSHLRTFFAFKDSELPFATMVIEVASFARRCPLVRL
jgi:hypothetical protein